MLRFFLPASFLVLFSSHASAQLTNNWVESFGGNATDRILDAAPAAFGGTFVIGTTRSFGQGFTDAWMALVNSSGTPVWEQALGGTSAEDLSAVVATPDGGCIAVGSTSSFGAGGEDGWVVKLASNGSVQWQRTYGGAGDERFTTVDVVKSNDFAPAYYVGGVAEFGDSKLDVWILKLSSSGGITWQLNYAGEENDSLANLAATDSGFAFVANSNSSFTQNAALVPTIPFFRPWIVTLHPDGKPDLQRTINYSGGDAINDILPVKGGYVLAGEIHAMAFERGDVWVRKIDLSLNSVWDRRYGDHTWTFFDGGARVRAIQGGFLVAGSTSTAGAGSDDLYLLRLDNSGNRVGDRTLGGSGFDGGTALVVHGRHAVVGGFFQPGSLQPADGYLARVPLPGLSTSFSDCPPVFPTSPNDWTSVLAEGVPEVEPTITTAVTSSSAAILTPLSTRTVLCP